MPLYEYECQQCQRRTEKIQKFSDPELTTCPHCGGRLERTLNAPAVHFAGGGWYKDLYSSPKPAAAAAESNAAKADAPAAANSSSSGESTSSGASTTPSAPASKAPATAAPAAAKT